MSEKDESPDSDVMSLEDALEQEVVTEEDLTPERLTELFRHKRVLTVEETDGRFRFIFRTGDTITVNPSAEGEIKGGTVNKYTREKLRGSDDTEGLSAENILELGDLVRLKEPYDPTGEYIEYTHGVVVEILGKFGDDLSGVPRKVSLHLYNPKTRDVYFDASDQHGSPAFVDRHIRQLNLAQKASDQTYHARDVDVAEYIDLGDRW